MARLQKRMSFETELYLKGWAWFFYLTNWGIELLLDLLFGVGEIASFIWILIGYALIELQLRFKGLSLVDKKEVLKFALPFILSEIPIIKLFYFKTKKNGFINPGMVAIVDNAIERVKAEDAEYNQKIEMVEMEKRQRLEQEQAQNA